VPSKKVVVALVSTVIIEVPEDWDEDTIDFSFNESSVCVSNLFRDIAAACSDTKCPCMATSVKYVKECKEGEDGFYFDATKG